MLMSAHAAPDAFATSRAQPEAPAFDDDGLLILTEDFEFSAARDRTTRCAAAPPGRACPRTACCASRRRLGPCAYTSEALTLLGAESNKGRTPSGVPRNTIAGVHGKAAANPSVVSFEIESLPV